MASFLKERAALRTWIRSVIADKGKKPGPITIVFCTDDQLLEVNRKYLDHDEYTDIITFDYSEMDRVSGDLMISVDRVKENAVHEQVSFATELHRVIIHGVLHLLGFGDKSASERMEMRSAENQALEARPGRLSH